jgi:ABC-type sugar transport system permease subunit
MMRARQKWQPWAMLGPSLVLFVVFFVMPVGVAAVESLFAWDMLTPHVFVGADNYRALARDGELLSIAFRTLGFSAMVVAGAMTLGLGLALLLNRKERLFAFVRASIFSAYVVSWVAVALLFSWMLDPDGGMIAAIFRALGLGRVGFLTDPDVALVTLAAVAVWKITGYAMIVFLAGLQSIPPELLEAAALDGARPIARFRWVTWPLLRPTAAFVATTSLVVSFQAFDVVRIMTQGGPAKSTTLFVYAIYEQIFLNLSVGRASALTVVFLLVLLLLTALQLRAWFGSGRARGAA